MTAKGAVVGVGVDVMDVSRVERWIARYDEATLGTIFTARELHEAAREARPAARLAASFAAKEAVGKALGTGLAGISWRDIELSSDGCDPDIRVVGNALGAARELGASCWKADVVELGELVLATAIGIRGIEPARGAGPAAGAPIRKGLSLIALGQLETAYARWGDRWLRRVVLPSEFAYVVVHPQPAAAAAARVAARRAVACALGPGSKIAPSDVAVDARAGAGPRLALGGGARAATLAAGGCPGHLSLSHAAGHAAALAVFDLSCGAVPSIPSP